MSQLIANPLDVVEADFPATGTAVEQIQFLSTMPFLRLRGIMRTLAL